MTKNQKLTIAIFAMAIILLFSIPVFYFTNVNKAEKIGNGNGYDEVYDEDYEDWLAEEPPVNDGENSENEGTDNSKEESSSNDKKDNKGRKTGKEIVMDEAINDPTLNEMYRKAREQLYTFKFEEVTSGFGNDLAVNGYLNHPEYEKVRRFNEDTPFLAQLPYLVEMEDDKAIERMVSALQDPRNVLIAGIYLPFQYKNIVFRSPFGLVLTRDEYSRISDIKLYDLNDTTGYDKEAVIEELDLFSPGNTDKLLITFNLDGNNLWGYLYKNSDGLWKVYEVRGDDVLYITYKEAYEIREGVR